MMQVAVHNRIGARLIKSSMGLLLLPAKSSFHPYRNVQSGHAEGLTITSRHVLVIGVGHREANITWSRALWKVSLSACAHAGCETYDGFVC